MSYRGKIVDGQVLPGGFFGYRVDPNTGVLTPVPGSPFLSESTPGPPLLVEPTGRFAYAPIFKNNNILAYAIDASSGALALIPGSPFAAGVNPIWISFRDLRPASLIAKVQALNLPFGRETSLIVKLSGGPSFIG